MSLFSYILATAFGFGSAMVEHSITKQIDFMKDI